MNRTSSIERLESRTLFTAATAYAIDDLHLQTALLDAAEAAVGDIAAATADLAPVPWIGNSTGLFSLN